MDGKIDSCSGALYLLDDVSILDIPLYLADGLAEAVY